MPNDRQNKNQDRPSAGLKPASRRRFLGGMAAAGAGILVGVTNSFAAEQRQQKKQQEQAAKSGDTKSSSREKSPAELITPQAQRAIDRGLRFLASRQVKAGANKGAFGNSGYASGVAVCGLAGLAWMCGGSAPDEGKYGKQVNECTDFILANVRDSGYIARRDRQANENMYGHGFAMLFLSEAYGMSQKVAISEKLRKAVDMTVKCQNAKGGWRYQPVKDQVADLSITVCQIMGLRAARDAGIHVPDETRAKCIDYVKKSQNADGSFRYQLNGGHSTFAMTAAGVTSLYSAGIYDSDQVKKALAYLAKYRPGGGGGSSSHYYYGQYYAVQAMWHAGGKYWQDWYPAIRDELIRKQSEDGSWPAPYGGPQYGAAMACIILQMPLNFLPVFSP